MASLSQDRAGEAPRPKPAITAHPAFGFVVALWFATLLGFGTLILPPALIERVVVMTGLPSLFSAAEPPLGFTARAAIALGATLLGALIGLLIARKVSRTGQDVPKRFRESPAQAIRHQHLNAHEDLGEEGLDGQISNRRRSLAIAEDDQPSEYLQIAPLPRFEGDDEESLNADEGDLEPLELGEAAEITEDEPIAAHDEVETPVFEEAAEPAAEPASATLSEPLEFSPPSLTPEPEDQSPAIVPEFSQPNQDFAVPPVAQTTLEDHPELNDEPVLEELGLIHLVQRLATTIEKHREWNARRPEASTAPAALAAVLPESVPQPIHANGAFETAEANEAAEARAAYFSAPSSEEIAPATAIEAEPASLQETSARDDNSDHADRVTAEEAPRPPQVLRPFAGLPRMDAQDDHGADNYGDLDALSANLSPPPTKRPFAPEHAQTAPANSDFTKKSSEPLAEPTPSAPAFAKPASVEAQRPASNKVDADENKPALIEAKNPFRGQPEKFVRVEEPEPEVIQPAVVFPHEAPAAKPADDTLAPRAFDPPTAKSAAPGQSKAASAASKESPKASNDEADRALRDALLNLQRMGPAHG